MALNFTGFETIPERTRDELERYVEHRIPTGGFLYAVLTNDLYSAVARADSDNLNVLADIARFVDQRLPGNMYGDPEKVKNHLCGLS
jgi:hypothetical protein